MPAGRSTTTSATRSPARSCARTWRSTAACGSSCAAAESSSASGAATTGLSIAPVTGSPSASLVSADERRLVDGLRAGDEAAFVELLRAHGPAMLRLARSYVSSRAVAEEVVQEAWLGVIKGIH